MTEPFRAVLLDMDGVITATATLHEQSWKRVLDEVIRERLPKTPPFSHDDYLLYVDGKPRHRGARDFLASRGLVLDVRAPEIRDIGQRKNAIYLELLDRQGVVSYPDTLRAMQRWHRGGLRIGVVTASRNGRAVLSRARLPVAPDVIVDGRVGLELGLTHKAALMAEAAARLGVSPALTVALEDAVAGVQAAREVGFGLVAGVDHDHGRRKLSEAGAHVVVRDVRALRFLRRLPALLDRAGELRKWLARRGVALFFDYDGTLTPIVEDPAMAVLSDEIRQILRTLSRKYAVAVISGRDRADLEARVGVEGIYYAGSHGFDIAGPGVSKTLPEADRWLGKLDAIEPRLRAALSGIDGAIVERKRYSIAAHYRMVAESQRADVRDAVYALRGEGLTIQAGKMVLELQLDVDWSKGHAADWLRGAIAPERALPILYAGDDETDEDVFASLDADSLGIHVGGELSTSAADYRLREDEVGRWLRWLAARRDTHSP